MKLRNRTLTRKEGEDRGRKPKDIKDCKTTISFSLYPKNLEKIELECSRRDISKSSFLESLIVDYFEGREKEKTENLEKDEKKTIDEIKPKR